MNSLANCLILEQKGTLGLSRERMGQLLAPEGSLGNGGRLLKYVGVFYTYKRKKESKPHNNVIHKFETAVVQGKTTVKSSGYADPISIEEWIHVRSLRSTTNAGAKTACR